MNKTLRIEDGLGNLDRILPNRANSFSLGRRTSRASNLGRRESNLSSLSVNSARSPLPVSKLLSYSAGQFRMQVKLI